jgi:hypothetical protein
MSSSLVEALDGAPLEAPRLPGGLTGSDPPTRSAIDVSRKVAFIGYYAPRQCEIATFTTTSPER